MDDIIDLYPVVAAPSGPPPSPRTKVQNTLRSLPRGIVDCPSYVIGRIYNASPVQTVDSISNFHRDYQLGDESIDDLLILAPPSADERLFKGRSSDQDPHFFYVFPLFFSILGVRLPFSRFICDVFSAVNAAPTQLAPNAWAFLRSFEILADYLKFTPPRTLFLAIYRVDGGMGVKHKFLSFTARKSLQLFEQCKSN